MAIDPNIILSGQGVRYQAPDPIQQYASLAHLAGALQGQQAQRYALDQAQEQRAANVQLRQLYQQGIDTSTPEGQQQLTQRAGALSPGYAIQLGESFRKQRKDELEGRKFEVEAVKTQAETAKIQQERLKMAFDLGAKAIDIADSVLAATTPETYPQDKSYLEGLPGFPKGFLPAQYDQPAVEGARKRALGQKELGQQALQQARLRLDADVKSAELGQGQQRIDLERLKNEVALNKVDYGLGADLDAALYGRYGSQLGPRGRPSPEQVAQARQDVLGQRVAVSGEQGAQAARIATSAKPLDDATGKQVGDIDTALKQIGDVRTLFNADYVGPVTGRLASIKEVTTGGLPASQVDFNRVLKDVADSLARARSGAAIPEAEYQRLLGLLPGTNLPADTFLARLESFERGLQQARESKLKLATTGRGDLPRPEPVSVPQGKSISAQELDAAFNDPKNKGPSGPKLTRQQLLDNAKKLGYEVTP